MTQVSGLVAAPSVTSIADNTVTYGLLQGKQGEVLDAKLHGDFYTLAYRGLSFFGTTATAGTTVPIQASALASTFCLWNPANSNKNVELLYYVLGLLNATTVVSDISLYFQTGIGSSNAALSSLTALVARPTLLGGSAAAQAGIYSAATFTGALNKGPTLVTFGATSTTVAGPIEVALNGRVILPPGCAVSLAGNAAQTQAMQHTFYWAENPI
jgi:hypothetical protein